MATLYAMTENSKHEILQKDTLVGNFSIKLGFTCNNGIFVMCWENVGIENETEEEGDLYVWNRQWSTKCLSVPSVCQYKCLIFNLDTVCFYVHQEVLKIK